jgi:hypothetical protein
VCVLKITAIFLFSASLAVHATDLKLDLQVPCSGIPTELLSLVRDRPLIYDNPTRAALAVSIPCADVTRN